MYSRKYLDDNLVRKSFWRSLVHYTMKRRRIVCNKYFIQGGTSRELYHVTYSATKGGVLSFTLAKPDDIANTALYLTGDD